jgi:hypothetical protein
MVTSIGILAVRSKLHLAAQMFREMPESERILEETDLIPTCDVDSHYLVRLLALKGEIGFSEIESFGYYLEYLLDQGFFSESEAEIMREDANLSHDPRYR